MEARTVDTHRLAAILCDDAEGFRVLHWCIDNLCKEGANPQNAGRKSDDYTVGIEGVVPDAQPRVGKPTRGKSIAFRTTKWDKQ